jgi:hypothetical protein
LFQRPGKKHPSMTASEELKSCLIASYERAVHNGLSPCSALAVMLEWVSEECARIRPDRA